MQLRDDMQRLAGESNRGFCCHYTQLGPSCYYVSLDHPFSYWLFQISLSVNLYQLSPLFIAHLPTYLLNKWSFYREDSIRRAEIANQNYYRIYLGLLHFHGCLVIKSCSPLLQPHGLYIATFATPWTIYSQPGPSVHGIFQARILEWVAISFSRGSSWPRHWTYVSRTGRQILSHWVTREAHRASVTSPNSARQFWPQGSKWVKGLKCHFLKCRKYSVQGTQIRILA